ncbi:ATP-binding Cassette (ABC) Superfamily [Achlya hypogyna]|uniref:ATP-binding Cassette (ABC) Superfamily n=1 Tax=Achlya hypogyna TaxID=1202772 RepID=A0A1V9Z475_ACHHY|nr:ATP-binding Cassette (ABC) Superfamily [Achlya hypogyna]
MTSYAQLASPQAAKAEMPITESRTKKEALIPLSKLFQYADRTDKALMMLGAIMAAATGVSQPIQILFFGDIINAFNPTNGAIVDADLFRKSINDVVLKFVYLGIGVLFSAFCQVSCWSIAASRQSKRIRHAYASAILRQEIGWFDVSEPMQLATRVADTTLLVQNGIGRKIGDGINYASMGIGSIVIAFAYGWELSLVLFAFTPFIGLSAYYMSKAITDAVQGGVDAYAEAGGIAEEALGNIKTVHMFNAMETIAAKYQLALQKTEQAGVRKGLAIGVGTGVMFLIQFITYGVGMYYGAVKITNDISDGCLGDGCYNGGRVITVFFCIVMGAMALGQAGPALQAIYTGRAAAQDIFALISRTSRIDVTDDTGLVLDSNTVAGAISLENITFAYPSRPHIPVCNGYSLHIPAGQKIALVGASGSGKSTIVSLLERFYDPLGGRVTLDGHDLKDLNLTSLRQQIGLVGQEPSLFADSIANNIRRGKPDATFEEVVEAAKQANAYNFVMGFPNGFDTEVGDRGAQLSGGQKQRIAIARAIIKNPSVLLLDEATSALDTESEHVVQASLDALVAARQRTTIIIAHRLSTIRGADRIVVLSDGCVVEDGTHEELLQIPHGHYKGLVTAQMRHAAADAEAMAAEAPKAKLHAVVRKHSAGDASDSDGSDATADASVESDTGRLPVPISRVWGLSRPEARYLVAGSVGAIVHGAVYPVWGVLLTKCVVLFYRQDLSSHEMRREAMWWGLGFLFMGLVYVAAIIAQNHQFATACERLTGRIRGLSFAAMLRQDMAWFDDAKHSPGALTTRLATDSAAIRSMTAETLNAVLVNASSLGVGFGFAFYYSWKMTLVLAAIFPILGFASVIEMQTLGDTGKDLNDGDLRAGALLSEAINAVRTVASFGLERSTNALYLTYLQQSAATDVKVGLKSAAAYCLSQGTMIFAIAFTFYFGGWLLLRGDVTFEAMMTVLNAILFCSFGVGIAVQGLGDVGKAKKAVQSIFAVIDHVPGIDAMATDGVELDTVAGDVQLSNLAFAYPTRPDARIYTNYSLSIASGQTLALVGGSGSGKSTAIALLQRFYDPSAGVVSVDGHDLRTLNLPAFRSHVAIVSQEPVLFSGSIADNIAMGKPGATRAEIEDAASKANAHDFICRFPDGYDTAVGDRGVQVSGGQKQRIAIARAIIRDPAILLLDEATSALDAESEAVVQASLDKLLHLKKRTTIIVAHRLSTIRNADVIAVVHDGRVAELGTHDQLMAIPDGLYQNLVARQMKK